MRTEPSLDDINTLVTTLVSFQVSRFQFVLVSAVVDARDLC